MADKPSHNVYVVDGEGEKAYWTKVGGGWPIKDGGLSIKLNSGIAVHGRLVVIAKKDDKHDNEQG